ncbi:hypothetical protein [Bradyrhizobium sp. CB3481]|uniref:hypothetical protein n=1 Tax=Bradyrhizobium sp. CB3481 TaxID=3039158 RepID=UPI0024B24B1D|nr:hypothetical protein [Bradyrhizobium sp. CB3481]WFU19725.1 hypothetical protein QA643_16035 [Bradyrhizobium sp. CB3481]
MSSDHDIMRLPDPPPPAPDARAAAMQQALLRFDQKSAEEKTPTTAKECRPTSVSSSEPPRPCGGHARGLS